METYRTGTFGEENYLETNSNNLQVILNKIDNNIQNDKNKTIDIIKEVMNEMDIISNKFPKNNYISNYSSYNYTNNYTNNFSNNFHFQLNNSFIPSKPEKFKFTNISKKVFNICNDISNLEETINRNILSNYTYNKYNNYGCTFTKKNDLISTGINTNSFSNYNTNSSQKINSFYKSNKNPFNKLYNSKKVNSRSLYLSHNFAQTNIFE